MRPNHRTWRIRGIPCEINRERLARAIRYHSDLQWPSDDAMEDFHTGGNDVIIHTLAPDLRDNYQVATVRFRDLPSKLKALPVGARDEVNIKMKISPEDPVIEVLADEHFDGITTLFSPVTDEGHQIDILAVSGLGSHPFGSFVNKKDGNMWLTNNLPRDIPVARVMIFGYESRLQNSRSHVELDDLGGPVHIAISQILQCNTRPLILIGHSLGGLLVKEALIRIAENSLPNFLDRITGILLIGTPNDGLDIESLVPMVNDQPNRSLLESLNSNKSQVLRRQKQKFSNVLARTKLQLFCLYETELSPTAVQDQATGRWKMDGPHRLLVSQPSATSCLPASAPSTQSIPLRRNHSDLVKFASHDSEYDRVAYILKLIQRMSMGDRKQEMDLGFHQVAQRPSERESATGQSQAGDHATLDKALLKTEMEGIKDDLILHLYFSKIDDRLTHLAPAQGTTCRWFLAEAKYRSWLTVAQQSEHGGFLWIKGNPGTGKSTLMKHLFEATKVESNRNPSRITLSFFFLARGAAEEKTTTGLYRSLLHQLFGTAPGLKEYGLEWITIDGGRTIQRNGWSEEALKQTLKYAVLKLGKRSLTMFIDALDECDTDKAGGMVSFFEELCECAAEASVQLKICFSSRYYPTVVITKGLEVSLEDENGHTEDIRNYVKLNLRLKSRSKHAEALRSEILEKSSGIFLWVVLVVDILNKEIDISIKKLRQHLKDLPPRLNDLFHMIITRDEDNREQLRLCLNWILFARRALQPQELYFAIKFGSDPECSGFWDRTDLDLSDMTTFVRMSSKGLAEVTRTRAREVQFIHESVRDFLLGRYGFQWSGTSESLDGNGHQVLSDCCLAQLNASATQKIVTSKLQDSISSKFPFLRYSVDNVLIHSNQAQLNGINQGHFLSNFPLDRWTPLYNFFSQTNPFLYTHSASLLYILGEHNLAELIRVHSRRKLCFQIEAQSCGAPILAALANNCREAVRAFLSALAEDEPPASPLHGLSERYQQRMKEPSIFHRYFNFTGRRPIQVLHDLVDGDEEVAALALVLSSQDFANGEPLDSSYGSWLKLLLLALERGHKSLLTHIIQKGAHGDKNGWWLDFLLLQADKQGNEAMVKLCLDSGADIQRSRRGGGGDTPLINASSMDTWP